MRAYGFTSALAGPMKISKLNLQELLSILLVMVSLVNSFKEFDVSPFKRCCTCMTENIISKMAAE